MTKEKWIEACRELIPVLEETDRIRKKYGIDQLNILAMGDADMKHAFCIEDEEDHYSVMSMRGNPYNARISPKEGKTEDIEIPMLALNELYKKGASV